MWFLLFPWFLNGLNSCLKLFVHCFLGRKTINKTNLSYIVLLKFCYPTDAISLRYLGAWVESLGFGLENFWVFWGASEVGQFGG